jgi:hypothetical protein
MEEKKGRWGKDSRPSAEYIRIKTAILEAETPDEALFSLFGITKGEYLRLRRDEIIITERMSIERAGFYVNTAEQLKFRRALAGMVAVGFITDEVKSGSQKGKKRYSFMRTSDISKAKSIWNRNPNLKIYKNPKVEKIGGSVDDPIPKTTQVVRREGLSELQRLLLEMGIVMGGHKIRAFLGGDLETAVYKGNHLPYVYFLDSKQKLREQIEERWEAWKKGGGTGRRTPLVSAG